MNFRTANSTRMIINSVGNVGINTTSPVVRLHVQGNNIATRTTTTAQSVLRLVRDVTDAAFPSTKDSAVDFMLSRQQSVNNNLLYKNVCNLIQASITYYSLIHLNVQPATMTISSAKPRSW